MNNTSNRCNKLKGDILSYVGPHTKIPSEQEVILRNAESMKLFELNGQIAFGKWREWSRARTQEGSDMMIKYAIDHGKDTAGPCTVRQLAAEMLNAQRIAGECVCELAFTDEAGRRINMECAVTMVDGVPHARQWKPKFSITRLINRWRGNYIRWRLKRNIDKWANKA